MNLQISYRLPKKKDVILFYINQEKNLSEHVLTGISYAVIEPYESICLHPKVLFKSFKNFFYKKYTLSHKSSFFSFKTLQNLYEVHLITYIEFISPKVILTAIDDSSFFQRISHTYPNAEFIAIQNGMRPACYFKYLLPFSSSVDLKKHCHTFFCFSQSEKNSFKSNGFNVNKFTPIGSFVGGIHWKNKIFKKSVYDICYISQWVDVKKNRHNHDGLKKLFDADILAAKFLEESLVKLIKKKDYSLVVALRHKDCEKELNHFKSIFGKNAHYILSEKENFSSYHATDTSKLIVNIYSTIGAEALGVGKKVLFCNGSGDSNIGLPEAGFCYYEGDVYNEFEKKVVKLLTMNNDEYQKLSSKILPNLMQYTDNKMPHEIIRSKILDTLKI
jgi:surface carbohydrate biosynthesis protein